MFSNLPFITDSRLLSHQIIAYANDIIQESRDRHFPFFFSADLWRCDFSEGILSSDELFHICHFCLFTVASSEESPVAMKLKKMWLKAPVSEDGDTNLGKRWLREAVVRNLSNLASYCRSRPYRLAPSRIFGIIESFGTGTDGKGTLR